MLPMAAEQSMPMKTVMLKGPSWKASPAVGELRDFLPTLINIGNRIGTDNKLKKDNITAKRTLRIRLHDSRSGLKLNEGTILK